MGKGICSSIGVQVMYKVNNALTSAYGPAEMDMRSVQGPDMPKASIKNRTLTNVPMGQGDFIMAMRPNPESDLFGEPKLAGDAMERPIGRPLRYTPGLKCDAHLESLRPERYGNHRPIQGGEDWKRKLVQAPNHFEGSFSDADMQKFRPEPNPNNMEDPWYASRLPEQTMQSHERLAAPAATYGYPELPMSGPYGTMYPQDQLSQIKMRNRRFMNACDHEMAHDELSVLDQELNMTRRANRPFVPQHHQDYYSLQRQVQDMEQPMETPRRPMGEVTSVEQLPLPKRTAKTSTSETALPASSRPQVNIADQIAIRSFVLGQSLGKVSGKSE